MVKKDEVKELATLIQELSASVNNLTAKIADFEKKLDTAVKSTQTLEKKITIQERDINTLAQRERSRNTRILGLKVPESNSATSTGKTIYNHLLPILKLAFKEKELSV